MYISYISIFLSEKRYLLLMILYTQLNPQAIRQRSTINKTGGGEGGRPIQEVRGSQHLVRIMRRIDEPLPPPRASSCRWEVAIFSQLDAHPGVIYSNYKSTRLPRWDACNACLTVRGRSNASIIHDPRRAWFVHVKVLEHVTNLRAPIFPHAYDPLDSYPEKVFY